MLALFPGPHLACLNASKNDTGLGMRLELCIAKEVDTNVSNTQLRCNRCMGKVKSHRHTIEVIMVNKSTYRSYSHTPSNWKSHKSVKHMHCLSSISISHNCFCSKQQFYSKQCLTPYPRKLNKETCTHFCSASEEFGHLWCSLKHVLLNATPCILVLFPDLDCSPSGKGSGHIVQLLWCTDIIAIHLHNQR